MSRTHGIFVLLCAGAVMIGTGAALTTSTDTASVAPAVETAAAPAPDAACGAVESLQPGGTNTACCIPECRRDRDCDRICGRNNGDCVPANSCCNVCACFS